MADGASSTVVDAFLAAILNATAPTTYGPVFIQLHVGAPGAAGTSNIAGNATRVTAGSNPGFTQAAFGDFTNLNNIPWTSVPSTETYTHVSIWSLATLGVFLASGSITANAVVIGDNFAIPVGDMAVVMPVAS